MIIIGSLLRQAKSITVRPNYAYHLEDIMRRTYDQKKITIYSPANHLYLDKLFNTPFNERKFIFFLLEQGKIADCKIEVYDRFFKMAIDNIDKFQMFKSFATILVVAYEIRFSNVQICKAFAQRAFQMLKSNKQDDQVRTHSYNICRLFIAINRLIGLQAFPNETYELISYEKLKPLFMTYIVQLFWQAKLQYKYPITRKLVLCLKQNQTMIPFSDAHHMLKAKKIILDPLFVEITDNLQKKIRKRLVSNQAQSTKANPNKISSEVIQSLFDSYVNDLKQKYL